MIENYACSHSRLYTLRNNLAGISIKRDYNAWWGSVFIARNPLIVIWSAQSLLPDEAASGAEDAAARASIILGRLASIADKEHPLSSFRRVGTESRSGAFGLELSYVGAKLGISCYPDSLEYRAFVIYDWTTISFSTKRTPEDCAREAVRVAAEVSMALGSIAMAANGIS